MKGNIGSKKSSTYAEDLLVVLNSDKN